MELYLKALRVAAHAHRNQVRKFPGPDGLLAPYIEHPVRVASRILLHSYEMDPHTAYSMEEIAAAAVLHDVVEDTDLSQLYVEAMFGWNVGGLVDTMTRKKGQGVEEYYGGFRSRHRRVARCLKLADIHENLIDSFLATPDFRRRAAAKYRRFLLAVTYGSGNPFDNDVPLDLWNSVVRLLGKVDDSTASTP